MPDVFVSDLDHFIELFESISLEYRFSEISKANQYLIPETVKGEVRKRITIAEGHGNDSCFTEFYFDAAGNFLGHGCFDD